MNRLRRWIASLVASALILLSPGLPAYAQVARITAGEAGVSAIPRGAVPNAASSSSFAPLATLSPVLAPSLSVLAAASAPSAIPAGAPALSAASATNLPAAAAPAAAALLPASRAAAADGVRKDAAPAAEKAAAPKTGETASAPEATRSLQTASRQAAEVSAAPGTDAADRAKAAQDFDASAPAPERDLAPARGVFSRLRSALSRRDPAAVAPVPSAASAGVESAPASATQAAAAARPSFARRTWNEVAGFGRDLRTMAFGDKKLEPLLGTVKKPRLKAQIFLGLDALSGFGMSFLIGALLDAASLAAKNGFAAEKTHLLLLSGALIAASLVYALIERAHALLSNVATTRAAGAYRMKLQDNLVHQPMEFHQEHPSGQLSSVIVKGVGYLTAQTTGTQIPIFHYLILLVFGAGMMLFVSPTLSVVTLALVPVLAFLAHHFQSRAWKIGEQITDQRKELTRLTEESLAMHATVAAFGTQEFEAARHARSVNETAALGVESANLNAKYGLVSGVATAISQQLLYIIGGIAKLAGWGLSFGRITALMLYAGLVQMGANGISSYHLLYQQAAGSANEASNLIKDEPKQADAPGAPALPAGPGAIHFENVTFGYPSRKAAPVLQNLDFKIEPGQTVALVGTTGSGKSTVSRLLLRQYEPTGGRITVDGRDVSGFTRKSLLGRMAVVPQTVALFSRSLRENMTYGSENVSEERLKEAIHRAGADDFINDKQRFPDGLETKITGGGTSLSGGERQRVGIVRALLREPSILILDEATSALDAATERKVQRRIAAMSGADGRRPTTLVIAHHLNTIRGADQIIVLEKGQIAEKGTHAELLALNGRYAHLWSKGGYASSDDETVEAETETAPAAAAAAAPAATAAAAAPARSAWARIRGFFSAAKSKTLGFLSEIKDYLRGDPEVGVFLPARRLWTLAGVALVQAIVSIGSANMLSHYLNGVYQTGAHGWPLWSWAIGAAVATGAQLLLTYGFSRRLGALRARAEAKVRGALFARLHAKDMTFFRENDSKGLATRHDDDVETLIKKNLDVRISAPANLIKFGVSLALLIHISLIAGGSVFLMLPLISVIGAFWGRRSDAIAQKYAAARKEVGRQGQEPLEMIATVKANGQEDAEALKYRTPIMSLVATGEEQAVINANAHVSASAVTEFFAKNLIYIVGAFMLATGAMPIGSVVLMLAYSGFIQAGATGLSSDWLSYTSARGETSAVFGWLTEKLAKRPNLPLPAGGGAISFDDVSFRYWENGSGGGVENVSLKVRPGETVAFVGETGSGKSTLLKLFQNLWTPKSGRVTLEGVPVGDLAPAAFGSAVAAVAQETPLFYDTLRYNMVYGTPNATDAELAAAIKAAQAGFVDDREAFPKGLDTMVGEGGAQLSGGQRQRVAIVRALLKRPRVLLLDEATSDLDKETEIAVKDAIAGMTYGADRARPTTLIVAHNLTTIRDADRIVVMSAGRVVEVGSHDELLARGGAYARLWHIQSQAR